MSKDKSVMFVAANPVDQENTHFDEEYDCISARLDFRLQSNPFRMNSSILKVNMDKLQAKMNQRLPYILHFSGHGDFDKGLYFIDDGGISYPISAEKFSELIRVVDEDNRICCVVLNACWTEEVAIVLSDQVPYVIGSERRLKNEAAIAFSKGFYGALAAGRKIENAYEQGKQAIKNAGIEDSRIIKILHNKELIQLFQKREEKMAKEDKQDKKGGQGSGNTTNNRTISVGGNVSGGVMITGDHNTYTQNSHDNTVPPAAGSIEEAKLCLNEIKDILAKMNLNKITAINANGALDTANTFISDDAPPRKEIALKVAEVIDTIKEDDSFESYKAELRSPIEKLKTWLGNNWMHLANLVGVLK